MISQSKIQIIQERLTNLKRLREIAENKIDEIDIRNQTGNLEEFKLLKIRIINFDSKLDETIYKFDNGIKIQLTIAARTSNQ